MKIAQMPCLDNAYRCQNIHLVPKTFDICRVRCIYGGALLAPPICYRIPEKPPPNLSNSPSDSNLCSVIIQQSILLAIEWLELLTFSSINWQLDCSQIYC